MTTYLITGNLGAGKTLVAVSKLKEQFERGRRIATNLDLFVEHLTRSQGGQSITRLPDLPMAEDFENLGRGFDGVDEDKFGWIFLDECKTFLGSRTWADKGRDETIKWLLHARKLGWHLVFIAQSETMIDRQVRTSLIEHIVRCKRLDRIRIPIIGWFLQLLGSKGLLPRIHIGVVKYGVEQHAPVVDRWIYTGTHLFDAYDTRQIFSSSSTIGMSSYLTPANTPHLRWPDALPLWTRLPDQLLNFLGLEHRPRASWHPLEIGHNPKSTQTFSEWEKSQLATS